MKKVTPVCWMCGAVLFGTVQANTKVICFLCNNPPPQEDDDENVIILKFSDRPINNS